MTGHFVVIAGDDDYYDTRFCEQCMEVYSKHPQVDIIRSRIAFIDTDDKIIAVDSHFPSLMSQSEYTYRYRIGETNICVGNLMIRRSRFTPDGKGFIETPNALGSDLISSIAFAEKGIACTKEILFFFRKSDMQVSSQIKEPKTKLEAITKTFQWLSDNTFSSSNSISNDPFESFYQSQITPEAWHEKCIYDYYNQVFKHLGLKDLFYHLKDAKMASPKEKILFVLRRLKEILT